MRDDSTGAEALVIDKWDRKAGEKGHTLVEYAGRGLSFPDDSTEPPSEGSYVGTYKLNPDGSWTGAGTGTEFFKGGDTTTYNWKEGSDLKAYTYEYTGGTGKYAGARGGGTYGLDEGVSRGYTPGTLQRRKYNDQMVLP